jgi:hypothetical protein
MPSEALISGYKQTTVPANVAMIIKKTPHFRTPPSYSVCLVMKMIVSEGWRHEYFETAWPAAEW